MDNIIFDIPNQRNKKIGWKNDDMEEYMKRGTTRNIVKTVVIVFSLFLLFQGVAVAKERLCVTANIANLRSGPNTKNDMLWQVEKYHPFIIVEKKGNWYKVRDFEGDVAWMHKSLLGKTKAVITVKQKCNVRSKPDKKSSIKFTVEKGVPFKVLKKNGNWINIEHADGDVGWIYKTLVW